MNEPNDPKRVEIIEIGLDEEIKKEIERTAVISENTKSKVESTIGDIPQPKKVVEIKRWEGKMDMLFNLLLEHRNKDPKTYVHKSAILASISIADREVSPTIQKFNIYLKTTKGDKWRLIKKRVGGEAGYAIVPFA